MDFGTKTGLQAAWLPFSNASFLPQPISAYFRKPSRITKPGSRNQSPKSGNRRRMTTQLPTRTRSVIGSQKFDAKAREYLHDRSVAPRPLSWHPDIVYDHQDTSYQTYQPYQQLYNPSTTQFAHGMATPTPFSASENSQSQFSLVSSASPLQGQVDPLRSTHSHYPVYPYEIVDEFAPTSISLELGIVDSQLQTAVWPPLPYTDFYNVHTAPTSPEFKPFLEQTVSTTTTDVVDENGEEELVGMGLYDSPAQVQSSGLLFSGSLPVRRKSLKLEESFEPAETPDVEDDDAESEDVDEGNQAAEQEVNPPQPTASVISSEPSHAIQQYYENYLRYQTQQEGYLDSLHAVSTGPSYGWM